MKGISLPINALIIIVLAMIVLVGILAFFSGTFNPSKVSMDLETAKTQACEKLASMGCKVSPQIITVNFDADRDGEIDMGSSFSDISDCGDPTAGMEDNLRSLCACHYGYDNEEDCKKIVCGCL